VYLLRPSFLLALLLFVINVMPLVLGQQEKDKKLSAPAVSTSPQHTPTEHDGQHDFDFLFGEWRVHHRVKLAVENQPWLEFDGTASTRRLMDGSPNVEDHTFNKPTGVSRGVAIRAYDPKIEQWAIWWIDSRDPLGAPDPPVKSSFDNGVGTFYSDGPIAGKPARTRFIWSHITSTSARWEQAYSFDAGKTWETNWIMTFTRAK
jgi:hypothetical protein